MIRFDYHALRNEAHAQYHSEFQDVSLRLNPDSLVSNPLYQAYDTARQAELNLLDEVRKSPITEQLAAQDKKRDEIFRGLSLAVQSAALHLETYKRERGKRLTVVFDNYGNIAQKPLDQETAAIDDLLRELAKTPYADDITNLQLQDWTGQLTYENNQFKQLMQARYEESGNRPDSTLRRARTETDRRFRALLDMFNVYIMINKDSGYKPFADNVNAITERYKNILAQEAGRRKKD
jgi:hypothetical protein